MDHPLNTISFVADVDNTLVIMVRLPPSTPRMTCHVLDACNVQSCTIQFFLIYKSNLLLGQTPDPCDR